MVLEHVAIWTNQLELLKDFYINHFGATANEKYINEKKQFESYFLTFDSGARLELMKRTGIPSNLNDTVQAQHLGLIHMAFAVANMQEVDAKAEEFLETGLPILSGPRKTGDGYYEFETLDPDNNRIEVGTVYRDI